MSYLQNFFLNKTKIQIYFIIPTFFILHILLTSIITGIIGYPKVSVPVYTPYNNVPYCSIAATGCEPLDESLPTLKLDIANDNDAYLNTGAGVKVYNSMEILGSGNNYFYLRLIKDLSEIFGLEKSGVSLSVQGMKFDLIELSPFIVIFLFQIALYAWILAFKSLRPIFLFTFYISLTLQFMQILLGRTSDIRNIFRYSVYGDSIELLKGIFSQIFFLYPLFSPFGIEPRNISILIFVIAIMLSIHFNNSNYLFVSLMGCFFSLNQTLSLSIVIFLYFVYIYIIKKDLSVLRFLAIMMIFTLASLDSLNTFLFYAFNILALSLIYSQIHCKYTFKREFVYRVFFKIYIILLISSAFLEYLTREGIIMLANDGYNAFILRSWQLEGFGRILSPVGTLLIYIMATKFTNHKKVLEIT